MRRFHTRSAHARQIHQRNRRFQGVLSTRTQLGRFNVSARDEHARRVRDRRFEWVSRIPSEAGSTSA